jgi:hypothetical protein
MAVSVQDPCELERAIADIEQAAIQASYETRRLWGQQAHRPSPLLHSRCAGRSD